MHRFVVFVLVANVFVVGKCSGKACGFDGTTNGTCETGQEDIMNGFDEHRGTYEGTVIFPAVSKRCQRDLTEFVYGLGNGSSWAIEMLDATSKVATGLISGNTYHLGNYDQCVSVLSPESSVRGKYCLAKVELSPRRNKYPPFYRIESNLDNEFRLDYDFYGSAFDKFKVTKDLTKKRLNSFQSGLCVPESCRSDDVETLVLYILQLNLNEYEYDANVTVHDRSCSVKEGKPLTWETIVLGSFLLGFMSWVLVCTVWDRFQSAKAAPKGKIHVYVAAFSLSRNIAKFAEHRSGGDMDIFNGMKCLSMFLIIMGHRGMASLGGPLLNPRFLEERYRKMQSILLLNGTLIVDTFFLIGGYLTFLTLFKECKLKKRLNFMQIYAYRWLRVAPVYLLVILFYSHLLEHTGSGPLWSTRVGREAERCRRNWWTNFLFINNYVNTESLCMFQSWYVTCDMHFTLVAPVVVGLIFKSPKKGLFFLGSLIAGSLLVTFLVVYHNKYDGVLRLYITTFEDLTTNITFNQVYIRSHHRGTPYFSGMAAAYLFLKLKQARHKFTKAYVWTYSVLAAISALSAICGAWIFYIPGRKYNAMENALYAATHRVLWAFSMSWAALVGGTKSLGILEPFLCKRIFTPFSKLSYSTFLAHGAIQLYTTSTLRAPEHMNFPKLYWMTCGDVILSFAVAFLLHIFFEAPIKGIQRILFSKRRKKQL